MADVAVERAVMNPTRDGEHSTDGECERKKRVLSLAKRAKLGVTSVRIGSDGRGTGRPFGSGGNPYCGSC